MRKLFYYLHVLLIGLIFLSLSKNDTISNEKVITNFRLKNINTKIVALSDYKNAKGFVVVFICNKCPMVKFYSERLNDINSKYKSKGVILLCINAMDTLAYAEESFLLMQKKAKNEKFNFPYLQDKKQIVAKQFNATHTPEAFVIWKNKSDKITIKYQGAIDDNAGEASKAIPLLTNAVDELLNNKSVSNPKTESFGCRIFYRGEKQKMN